MPNPREFLPADAVRPERVTPPEAAAVALDYPSTPGGTLGQSGQTLAQQLLA